MDTRHENRRLPYDRCYYPHRSPASVSHMRDYSLLGHIGNLILDVGQFVIFIELFLNVVIEVHFRLTWLQESRNLYALLS